LVVACNTASAFAVDTLREAFDLPVVGVVRPGAQLAAQATKNGRVGVIGTEGTIASGSYQRALAELSPESEVRAVACPLLVPLAEEGMVDHPATRLLAEEYLDPLIRWGLDTLVLGCTHYPILRPLLQKVVGAKVQIIDSATAVARAVQEGLRERRLLTDRRLGEDRFYATDVSQRVLRVGQSFLGSTLDRVELVDL
jgi:glutamate racemase